MEHNWKTIIEPFKIKSVEPLGLTTRAERATVLEQAHYNLFNIRAEKVLIDLLTDSGTGAMSAAQWGGIMVGDESYAGARSYYNFETEIKGLTGFSEVIPVHQGRAAEKILFGVIGGKGKCIISNSHFDTTRANVEFSGAEAMDFPVKAALDFDKPAPFKGNADVAAMEKFIKARGAQNIPLCVMTVTNNSLGGQPVSMENLKAVQELCRKYGIPMFLDCARFAENAYFIKLREEGFADRTPKEIAQAMFALSDGAVMSMKKDAFGNIGGVMTLNSDEWADRVRNLLILTEGFPTYGGLAGRDLEALAIGLQEIVEEEYLRYRITSTAYVGTHLQAAGVPLLKPFGGHAVYLNGRAFCDHLPDEQFPGWSLSVALYRHTGVRACEIGNVMFGREGEGGCWRWPTLDLVRLAIPRRVYTQSHMDYVVEGIVELFQDRHSIPGLRFVHRPEVLPHFTATFAPVSD